MMTNNAKIFLEKLQRGESLTMRTIWNRQTCKRAGYSINGKCVSKNTFDDVEGLPAHAIKDSFCCKQFRKNFAHQYILRRDVSKLAFDN